MSNKPNKCVRCGASHGLSLEDRETGINTPLNICYNCMWFGRMVILSEDVILKEEDVDGWFSVKDRTPNHNELIGYTYDGKSIRTGVYYLGDNGSWESENGLGYSIDEHKISHWMPLPNPPKQEV